MDLVQLFSYDVIPKVMRFSEMPVNQGERNHYTVKQTPELRSMLTKKIYFQNIASSNRVKINSVYDGEKKDDLFKIGRKISKSRSTYFGEKVKREVWYQVLLYTIHAVAKDEPEVCQRAVAWTINNMSKKNKNASNGWYADCIEEVCWLLSCWQSDLFQETKWNQDLEDIDNWLPNVFEELEQWDFSMNSTYFNNPSIDNRDLTKELGNVVRTVKIGNIQFYQ